MTIQIRTQAELDQAIKDGYTDVEFVKKGDFEINCPFLKVTVKAELKWEVLLKARGSSSVEAWESSRVEAWESSSVEARGSSSVVAWESSSVEARGSSRVVARGSSSVEAWESSSVEARGSSRVVARGSSRVEALGSSSVVARGSSRVEAWESSRVEAWESSRVEAWESSSVEARGSSSVVARGSSSVEARGSSRVVAWGNVFIRLYSALKIKASACVVIIKHGDAKECSGGRVLEAAPDPTTGAEWCDFNGIDPENVDYKLQNIDAQILEQIEKKPKSFDMQSWHGADCNEDNWCNTTHCRAGYAICLAGKPGFDLEKKYGAEMAGQMIYAVSRPNMPLPDFHADNEDALDDIRNSARGAI